MNHSLKTSAVLLTLSLALTTGTAISSATPAPTETPQSGAQSQSTLKASHQTFTIEYSGALLPEAGYQPAGGKEPLVPLRTIADVLGFKLRWNAADKSAELSKDSLITTARTGQDLYAVNKMNLKLGTAPAIHNNKMYVPASFIQEVLHQSITVKGNAIIMNKVQESMVETGVITAIHSYDKYLSVQIKGMGGEGLVLNVGEDTGYFMSDGTPLSFKDLHLGMTVEAEHSMITTMSLPPQTPAYQITVLDHKKQPDLLGTAGVIEEVQKTEDGGISIRIKGTGLGDTSPGEVVLRIAADTALIDSDGEAVKSSTLMKGASVIGFYSPMLTRSLPPIGTAWKVVIAPVE